MSISIKNTTKKRPRVAFLDIKDAILGKRYELSLVLCGKDLMKRLSVEHKGNTKHTNVLSFPIDQSEGEIFINVHEPNIAHLFIHGCLHLKGYAHGEEMEKLEDKYLKKFTK